MPKEIEAQHIFVPALGIFLGVALVIIDSTLVNVACLSWQGSCI